MHLHGGKRWKILENDKQFLQETFFKLVGQIQTNNQQPQTNPQQPQTNRQQQQPNTNATNIKQNNNKNAYSPNTKKKNQYNNNNILENQP